MKIVFRLAWASSNIRKSFKSKAVFLLFDEYVSRIDRFDGCAVSGLEEKCRSGVKIWVCHTSKTAKMFSSEQLAAAVQNLRNSGTKELQIMIGPADGFTDKDIKDLEPDLLWSFGPMTYPHELASVIAAEQIYRAYAIIHRLPYHSGH